MSQAWMVRAASGEVIDDFAKGYVALGWEEMPDLSDATERETIRDMYEAQWPEAKPGQVANSVGMMFKFRNIMKKGDNVVSYDPTKREYLVGKIDGDYFYDKKLIPNFPHLRKAVWEGWVGRDKLPVATRNTLGSTLTVFTIPGDAWDSIAQALKGKVPASLPVDEEKEEIEESREDTAATARELIKDQIVKLSPSEMQELVGALLRAMGYRTRISPPGSDRGVDVFASPDGLGFQEPRIKAEVKHRPKSSMGSQELRSFIGGLREGDSGLYVSIGGFSKDAKYEADRSKIPVTLLDLDDLADSIITHYEAFDIEGRALLPMVRVYWPKPI